ncbi:GGDEF domain-containing protein [Sphingopyxis sp. LC363]|jgi:diguanylate cyclase (GGDEF)-like protein|uniref:GGDEF domain-containing protein n=1 Tax=Sphingopyxis sp. LC363 TaxID=1120705 RepID=UPI00050E4AE1|nr:diguanylate cyclase [Sphingopyxis sp. LC363]KGB58967.1 Diguanylate cyclase/phosphodiesterase [Sphingopyxis sp. LC363]
MTGVYHTLQARFFPPIPDAIRDDVAVLRANRVETLTPMLFLMLAATTPTAIYAGVDTVHPVIRIGFPVTLAIVGVLGFLFLRHNRGRRMSPRRARRVIREASWVSGITGAMCSLWTVTNWLAAPPEAHSYYAMIMAMGSLATAYCLSSIRFATFLNLGVGLAPVSALMLTSGNPPEIAAGTSLVIATLFLLRMVVQQHGQVIDLLELQRQMRELAHTDPLTGLANRREFDLRLDEEIARADGAGRFAIALLDLNGFKPINDRHGHAIGDGVLCELADRLRRACGNHAIVARQGGDEFAILVPAGSPLLGTALADHILAALAAPYRIDGRSIGVGAGIGTAYWPEHGDSARQLLEVADRALYAAKAASRPPTSSVESVGRVA